MKIKSIYFSLFELRKQSDPLLKQFKLFNCFHFFFELFFPSSMVVEHSIDQKTELVSTRESCVGITLKVYVSSRH